MDLRKEAEDRIVRKEKSLKDVHNRNSFRLQTQLSAKSETLFNEKVFDGENDTPKVAKLMEIDYKWNGARARANSDDFVLPRWVPDEEVTHCRGCNSEFDYINRKHHCRRCGMVHCEQCTDYRDLLPHEFGYRDPVRVCRNCHEIVLPYQQFLSTNIANHQRINNIDVASSNCQVRRFMNLPFSSTLGSEIRKAAYSTYNLFSQPLQFVRDKAIPLRLLATAKGLAFITVLKAGFVFAPRIGTMNIFRLYDKYRT